MKPEDLNPENNDMEVRITALLLGELSPAEEAEVQAAIAQDPELTRLHDRLKVVFGLVKEAVPTTELPVGVTPEPLTLAQERREELLAVFKGGSPKAKEKKVIKVSFWRRYQKDLLKLAAMVVALLGMGWLMVGKREEQMGEGVYAMRTGESKSRFSLFGLMDRDAEYAATPPPASAAPVAVGADYIAAPIVPADPFKGESGEVTTVLTTNALVFYNRDAKAVPENRPQVRFSNRASGSAEPTIDWNRTAGGGTTSPSKAKAAPGSKGQVTTGLKKEDVGGLRFYYADDMALISPSAGVSLQVTSDDSVAPMGNVQTRHYSIALPQAEGAEVAQVKELSDLSLAGGIREESRMGGGFKGGQVAQAGGMGGGAAGANNNWGFTVQSQSGVANFTTPNITTYDSSKDIGGVMPRGAGYRTAGQLPFVIEGDDYFAQKRETMMAATDGDKPVQSGNWSIKADDMGVRRELRLNLESKSALTDGSAVQRTEGERFYRETPPAPPKPMTATASDKVDAWRLARQESLPELRAKENAKGEALVDGGVVMGDRLARGLERNGRAESMTLGLPMTPAQPARPNLDAVELNFTSPTGAPAKPGSSTPGNMVGSGGVALGDAQKNVWYDNSKVVAGATVADPKWTGTLQSPAAGSQPQGDRENKFVGRNAMVVLPAGNSLDLKQIQDEAKNPMPANQPQVGQTDGLAVITGGLRSNLGVAVNGLPPVTTDFGTRAKAVQLGKDSDADYVVEGEKLAKQQVDRFGASVVDGRKLSEPAPVVAMDLKPTTEGLSAQELKEAVNLTRRIEVLKGEKQPLPAAAKVNKEEASRLVQDAKLLRELRRGDEAEAKLKEALKQDPANSAAHYYLNLQQEAKYGDIARKRDYEQRARIVDVEKAWEIPATRESLVEAKESRLPKAPVVGEELAKLSDENKPVVALKQVADQMDELKAVVKKAAKEEDVPAKKPAPAPPGIPQPEVSTAQNAFSTFSLNVSDVSFKLAAASLEKGLMPELGSVRTEEFINAFNYHDPEPTGGSRIAFAWERARYPFAHDRDLVRFSVQTAAVGREPGKPLNIVLLLDNSGSMERADRLRIRQECLRVLASQLQPQDKVSVVSFARTARLWVDGLTGAQVKELPERVGNLTPEGGTNLEAAMDLAYQTVQKHFAPQGVNRVVLLTDGAANLGEVQPESLKKKVVSYRQQGVALDCFGIGWEGYNDDLLEALSRNGDGRYGFVNSPEAATTEFAAQLSGALKVAASDVKVQVEWNPKRVTVFRQLGYAKHQLKKEEFRDNTVDAAEIGAAEAGNALYTVQVNAAGEGPLGVVRVRYRLPGTNDYREQEWPLAYDGAAKEMQQASVPLRLAGTASAFSEWLVSSPYAGEVTPEKLIAQMAGVPEAYPADPRPKQLEWMIRQAKSLSGR